MTNPIPPHQVHGGNIDAAVRRFGVPHHQWLDLSTGINPRPYPISAGFLEEAHWTRLPGADALAALNNAALTCYGAPAEAVIAAAAGSQSLIAAVARTTPATRVAVVEPTYSEHALAWRAAGHDVVSIPAIDDAPAEAAFVVLCNPNNPDGRVHARERLLAEAKRLAARGGALVVDEAFGDTAPGTSLAPHAGTPGLVVLRSFGKFFGLAGVRLGFALCEAPPAKTLETALGPWAVSGPALAIGTAALDDANWIAATRLYLAEQAARLDTVLAGAGLDILGGTDLFRLVQVPGDTAADLAERLGEAGILVRTFATHPGWMRFGLPGNGADMERLGAALN